MQELIDGLKKQLSIYETLYKSTIKEKEAFSNKDNDLFMSVLSERLKLMDEISQLEGKLRPLREDWIERKDALAEDFNEEVLSLVENIKGIMDKILEIENSVIESKMQQNKEVKSVPKRKAINSYKKI